MAFWNWKKKRTTAKPKNTASVSKPKGNTDEQIATMLLGYGPKANLEEHGILEYRVEIEDGFIV